MTGGFIKDRRRSEEAAVVTFLKISQENICTIVSFSLKLQACNFIKKETPVQVFTVHFTKLSRTPFIQNTSGRLLLDLLNKVVS